MSAAVAIVAADPAMRAILETARRVAATDTTLLVSGESGTGKDLLARWVHDRGPRAGGPFVTIDCGTLPEALFEAELFGYERGAFTGASAAKPGRLEAAQGGTLVLDEIAGLTLQAQAKLLRVIEERRFVRLGGRAAIRLDVRFIALSNVDLADSVARKAFRADLFHRLNVLPIDLPPLRERRADLAPLIAHFLTVIAERHARPPATLTPEALAVLRGYDFPGNARELFHLLERAVLIADSPAIGPDFLPSRLTSAAALIRAGDRGPTLAELEAVYIREVLAATRGRKTAAAAILGISRKNLYEKMRAYGIPLQPEAGPGRRVSPRRIT